VPDLALYVAFQGDGPPVLLLAGQAWKILEVDWNRRRLHVEPIDAIGRVRFAGTPAPLRAELCRAIGDVLAGESPGVTLSKRATNQLDEDRATIGASAGSTLVRREEDGRVEWWTFAGLKANLALAGALGSLRRERTGLDNLRVSLDPHAWLDDLRVALAEPPPPVEPPDDAIEGLKFGEALPGHLAAAVVRARLSDPGAVQRVRDASRWGATS